MKPTISVIIPTYNRAEYIKSAITSVLSQKMPPGHSMEVLVIDDGSTDNTEEIVAYFKDKIIYKRLRHSGRPAVPRNVGLQMAKGELIAFQDSDDYWQKDKLLNQVRSFDDPEVILAYGNAEIIDEKGKNLGKILKPGQASSGRVFDRLLEDNFISTLTVMARKKTLLQAAGFNENDQLRGVEDYELWLRLSLLGKFRFINSTLALYRTHSQNISSKDPYTSYVRLSNVFRSILATEKLNADQKRITRSKLISVYHTLGEINPQKKYFLEAKIFNQKLKRRLV